MEIMTTTLTDWQELVQELGKSFETRAAQHDREGSFVAENYEALKANKLFSAAIPEEHGGGGATYQDMCNIVRVMAHACGSTALAFSMHQHLVAAAVWRYRHRGESVPMLQKVAANQLVLVSTGAKDWLESNGEMIKTEGGFLFSAKKHFASQSSVGNVAITSAPYLDERNDWYVLHFPVPLKDKGVLVSNDWDTLGMRATGSHTIVFDKVFVPDSAVALTRPRTGYHPVWDLVLAVAMPLIMSAYFGIAEKAMEIALSAAKKYGRSEPHIPYLIGKMNNVMVSARTQWKAMYALTDNLSVKPTQETAVEMLSLKTNVANACMELVKDATEVVGGQSFYRKNILERLIRDVQGAQFHPLPMWEQYAFTGERLLGR